MIPRSPPCVAFSSEHRRFKAMNRLRARVKNGRLVLDEPTTLPDGTVLDLVLDDEGDDLSDQDREALHEALSRAHESLEKGSARPASAILEELRARR